MTFKFCICIFLLWSINQYGQELEDKKSPKPFEIETKEDAEELFKNLPTVTIYPQKQKLSRELLLSKASVDEVYYQWLKQKVYRVYPYVEKTVEAYLEAQKDLNEINSSRLKRKYIKEKQKLLTQEHEEKLRKLTRKEGQILCKLFYRETGKSYYQIIRELRSSWSAFWWNIKARLYDISLKKKYDPQNDIEDHYIEIILLEAFNSKELIPFK